MSKRYIIFKAYERTSALACLALQIGMILKVVLAELFVQLPRDLQSDYHRAFGAIQERFSTIASPSVMTLVVLAVFMIAYAILTYKGQLWIGRIAFVAHTCVVFFLLILDYGLASTLNLTSSMQITAMVLTAIVCVINLVLPMPGAD